MPPVRSNKLLIFTPYLEVLRPDWGENFFLSEGVEQSGQESFFAFHPCAVIGTSDSRSFQQLLERGFQARGLLRQRWIASASAWMPGESIPSSFVTRIFMIGGGRPCPRHRRP